MSLFFMWKLVRIWILFSWSFLTIGILLGSWWAYHELGWGGWWFWDPVENASLMPWLLATASIHSITKPKLNYWTLICTQTTFILSILGTFFVRSGLLSSVHSFATDSTRGLYLLLFLLFITAISVFNWISLSLNTNQYETLADPSNTRCSKQPLQSALARCNPDGSSDSKRAAHVTPRCCDCKQTSPHGSGLDLRPEAGPPAVKGGGCLLYSAKRVTSFSYAAKCDRKNEIKQASGDPKLREFRIASLIEKEPGATCGSKELNGEHSQKQPQVTSVRKAKGRQALGYLQKPRKFAFSATDSLNPATTPVPAAVGKKFPFVINYRGASAPLGKSSRPNRILTFVNFKGSSPSEIKRSLEQILFLQNFYLCVICIVVFCGTSAPILFHWLWNRDVGTGAPFYNAMCIPLFTSVFFVLLYAHYIQFNNNISNNFYENSTKDPTIGPSGLLALQQSQQLFTNCGSAWRLSGISRSSSLSDRLPTIGFEKLRRAPGTLFGSFKQSSASRVNTLFFLYCSLTCLWVLHVFIGVQLIGFNILESIYCAICFLLISSILISQGLITSVPASQNSSAYETFVTSLSSLPSRHLALTPKFMFGINRTTEVPKNRSQLNQPTKDDYKIQRPLIQKGTVHWIEPELTDAALAQQTAVSYTSDGVVPVGPVVNYSTASCRTYVVAGGPPPKGGGDLGEVHPTGERHPSQCLGVVIASKPPLPRRVEGSLLQRPKVEGPSAQLHRPRSWLEGSLLQVSSEGCLEYPKGSSDLNNVPNGPDGPNAGGPHNGLGCSKLPSPVGWRCTSGPRLDLRPLGWTSGGGEVDLRPLPWPEVHPASVGGGQVCLQSQHLGLRYEVRPQGTVRYCSAIVRRKTNHCAISALTHNWRSFEFAYIEQNRGRIQVLLSAREGCLQQPGRTSSQMNVAHAGIVFFILGILLSNTFKFEFTEQLHSGTQGIRLGSQICCLRSIDHSFAPTYHSICANLLVYQQGSDRIGLWRGPIPFGHNTKQVFDLVHSSRWSDPLEDSETNAVCMFPEKRFYYLNQVPNDPSGPSGPGGLATKVAIHSNLFTDFYSLIGTGSFETGWFTTIMKLPFIFCIWLGFMFGVIGGFLSLKKQLQKSKLSWV